MEKFYACFLKHGALLTLGTLALSLPQTAAAQPLLNSSQMVAANSSFCVDIDGASTANGVRAIQFTCEPDSNQQFTLRPAGANVQILAGHSGKCLGISGNSLLANAEVQQFPCSTANNLVWQVLPSGTGFQFRALSSGLCMDVSAGSTQLLAPIVQNACTGAARQQFRRPGPVAPLNLKAQHSGKCADVVGDSLAEGARFIQFTCENGANEQFTIVPEGGFFRITVNHSQKCLTIENGSLASGAPMLQESCDPSDDKRFSLVQRGTNFQLVAKHSGMCINVEGASLNDLARIIQSPCTTATNQLWSITRPESFGGLGQWSAIVNLPLVPVAAANLTNGQLLVWSAYDRFNFGGDNGRTYTALFNPATNTSTETLVSNTAHDMFCPGTANLPDGRILVNGGSSSTKTSIYNPATNSWQTAAVMQIGRGYHGDSVTSTGEVFTIGGSWSGPLGGKNGEVWNATTGWRSLPGASALTMTGPDPAGVYRGDNHAWLFTAPTGEIFHAGPTANMNFYSTAATGSSRSAGNRGTDGYSMNGNAAMFDVGKILKVGGAPAYDNANATSSAYLIDINSGVAVTRLPNMGFARAFHSSVVLPNGEVVVFGGQAYPVPFIDTTAVYHPEIFSPVTRTFKTLAAMQVPRTYHSVAILLPNGKIFVGGGGLCGSCPNNHANAEIFTPPYLQNPDGTLRVQPAITNAPTSATWGGTANVTTNGAVTKFVLMRMSSITHTVNNDQRRVPLSFVTTGINAYRLTIPTNRGVVLPGYYMLFASNAAGTPSVARILQIR